MVCFCAKRVPSRNTAKRAKSRQSICAVSRGLPGAHNHQNACAAYGALRTLGLAPRVIEEGFKSFAGLAHRSQFVREINGVRYINDSKATNIDAAAKALGRLKTSAGSAAA